MFFAGPRHVAAGDTAVYVRLRWERRRTGELPGNGRLGPWVKDYGVKLMADVNEEDDQHIVCVITTLEYVPGARLERRILSGSDFN